MAGAYLAAANDVQSISWNPAGLARLGFQEFSVMYNPLVEGMSYQSFSYAQRVEDLGGSLGISASYFSSGTVAGYDASGAALASFSNDDWLASVAYGTEWEGIQIGVTAKYLMKRLQDFSASGILFDAGIQMPFVFDGLKFGAAVKHVGTGLKFIQEVSPFPATGHVGLAYTGKILERELTVAMDAEYGFEQRLGLGIGAEYEVWPWIRARVGYLHAPDRLEQGVRAGMEFGMPSLHLDYAFVPFGILGSTHRMSVTVRLGEFYGMEAIQKNIDAHFQSGREAYQAGDFLAARRVFQSIVAFNPSHVQARDSLSQLDRDVASTLDEMRRDQLRQSIARHYEIGQKALSESNLPVAREEFESVLKFSPDHTEAKAALVKVEEQERAFKEGQAKSLLEQADKLYGQEQYEKAIKLLEQSVAFVPNLTGAKVLLESAREKQREALKKLEREEQDRREKEVAAQRARDIEGALQLGSQFAAQGEWTKAVEQFDRVLILEPSHEQASKQKGSALAQLAQKKAAGLVRQGQDLEKQGLSREALAKYDEALKMDSSLAEAKQGVERIEEKHEKMAEELYLQGMKAYAQGQVETAASAFKKALSFNPDHQKAKQALDRVK